MDISVYFYIIRLR